MSVIITNTISLPELIWTVVAIFGAYYVSKGLRRSTGNLRYLRVMGWNSTREDAARISVLIFSTFMFVELMNVTAGIIVMTIPSASPKSVHPFTYVVATVFIIKAIGVAISSYCIDRMQVALIDKLNAAENDEGNGVEE